MARNKNIGSNDDIKFFMRGVPTPEGECWNWPYSKNENGYGIVTVNGRRTKAHRQSFELHFNCRLPEQIKVRHTCDNPACINPAHLLLGSQSDNCRDMVERGRYYTKLHPDEIKEIIEKFNSGQFTRKQLAQLYFMSYERIVQIVRKD
jgi:HNH endonuclease